jgi:YD repeat-containing protein
MLTFLTLVNQPGGRTRPDSRTYKYDGEGRRRVIEKPDGTKELLFYTDAGQLLSKFALAVGGTPVAVEDVIYLDGERIATRRYPELSDPGNTVQTDVVGNDVVLNWAAAACANKVDVRRATDKQFTDGTTICCGRRWRCRRRRRWVDEPAAGGGGICATNICPSAPFLSTRGTVTKND